MDSCSEGDCGPVPKGRAYYLLDIGGTGNLEDKVVSLNARHHNGDDALSIPPIIASDPTEV